MPNFRQHGNREMSGSQKKPQKITICPTVISSLQISKFHSPSELRPSNCVFSMITEILKVEKQVYQFTITTKMTT